MEDGPSQPVVHQPATKAVIVSGFDIERRLWPIVSAITQHLYLLT